MGSPQQRISPSKESRSRQIRNPKTQENRHPPTAFLQNRILAHVKSPRQINRFRILHGRLLKTTHQSSAGSPGAMPYLRITFDTSGKSPAQFQHSATFYAAPSG